MSGVKLLQRDRLVGSSFGESKFALYEACSPAQRQESPYVFVWLHGLDAYEFTESDARLLHQRLGRRVICLAPRNPEDSKDGRRFIWGLHYTKAQNKNGCGFIFGETNAEYLESMCGLVQQTSERYAAEKVIVCGYSAGGFGALQLGSAAPELFNAVICVAGHGQGTLEEHGTPQPDSSKIFQTFLEEHAPRLAMTAVIVVHARRDTVSSFKDAQAIADAVQACSGNCAFVEVPDEMANSDAAGKKKKSKAGHSYYFYSLLNESSEEVIHGRLRAALSGEAIAEQAAGGDAEGPAGDVGELVAEAQARLKANRTQATSAIIERLKRAHGLSEEVELALRMLAPRQLQELGANTVRHKPQLLQAEDKNAFIFSLVSNLDPSVEALVQGLLQMDAASDGNGAQQEEEEEAAQVPDAAVVTKARARLRYNKARSDFPAIARLKADCRLTEEVELALKLLTPEHLAEVLAGWSGIKAKVRERQDGGKFLISIISQLDPEVEVLVRGILALEAQGDEGPEAEAEEGGEEVLAAARARLQAPKGKKEMAGIKRLVARHGLGEEVELALRMLSAAHLREILAGEAQLTQKMAQVDDKGKLMLWLVSQLDPDVEALVQKILEIDGQGDGAEEPTAEAADASGQGAEEMSPEEAIAEARARLQANKSTTCANAIASFRAALGLGDEVELAMRMLVPAKLFKLTARKLVLKRELANVQDRNHHVLSMISELDPSVEALVQRFLDMDGGAQGNEVAAARGVERSRSPPRRAPVVSSGGPAPPPSSRPPHPRGSLAKQMPGWI